MTVSFSIYAINNLAFYISLPNEVQWKGVQLRILLSSEMHCYTVCDVIICCCFKSNETAACLPGMGLADLNCLLAVWGTSHDECQCCQLQMSAVTLQVHFLTDWRPCIGKLSYSVAVYWQGLVQKCILPTTHTTVTFYTCSCVLMPW
jgi:hypothetical protein